MSYVNVVDVVAVVAIAALTINNTARDNNCAFPQVKLSHTPTHTMVHNSKFKQFQFETMWPLTPNLHTHARRMHFAERLLQYVVI